MSLQVRAILGRLKQTLFRYARSRPSTPHHQVPCNLRSPVPPRTGAPAAHLSAERTVGGSMVTTTFWRRGRPALAALTPRSAGLDGTSETAISANRTIPGWR
ncbi:hypothetical protein GCM10023107_50090 [Actinoplanes octamycinicus]